MCPAAFEQVLGGLSDDVKMRARPAFLVQSGSNLRSRRADAPARLPTASRVVWPLRRDGQRSPRAQRARAATRARRASPRRPADTTPAADTVLLGGPS